MGYKELVIKIPDNYLKGMKIENGSMACKTILDAVYNGIPLPKGHGRLKDVDALLEKQYRIDDSATLSTRDVVNVEDVEDASTIIEAESEEE